MKMMRQAGFVTTVGIRYTRRGYVWGCSASSPRGRWDIARSKSVGDTAERRYEARGRERDGEGGRREYDDDRRGGYRGTQRSYRDSRKQDYRDLRDYRGSRDSFGEGRTDDRDFDLRQRRPRDYREVRNENKRSGKYERRPSMNAETLLIREALDSGDELLYGINPVLQALLQNRRSHFTKLFTQERQTGMLKADNQASLNKILALAAERDIEVVEVCKGSLNALTGERPHQGVVLATGVLPVEEISRLEVTKGIWLALDEVSDPHNVGAIIRSCVFFGINGVLLCKKNCCGLTPAVSKASVGALESCCIRYVGSMPRFLRRARGDGWRVLGMGIDGGSMDDVDIGDGEGVIVVVGNEGVGMRKMVMAECDEILKIDGVGDVDVVDCLNVSVATGVTLFKLSR